jgi:hypothetical protein
MEIKQDLRSLYRHWEKHAGYRSDLPGKRMTGLDRELLVRMGEFARERMLVWEKRQQGLVQPWTEDPVIAKFRFCNIYRELDKQTIELHRMLAGQREDFALWLLNMFFGRMVCRPETLRQSGLLSFDESSNQEVYRKLMAVPRPRYGTAYVFPVSTIMRGDYPTREKFLCFYLPKIMREMAGLIGGFRETGVSSALEKVLPLFGVRLHFLWTEVLIDTAYQYPELINLFERFPIGPGSIPTMKRLNADADPEEVCLALVQEKPEGFPYLELAGRPVWLSAENWEGIGCEFRKYTNLSQGNGRKRKYSSRTIDG